MNNKPLFKAARRVAGAALALLFATATQAATFQIIDIDDPGPGFNDPTPVAPIGGNTSTTLGEQRQIVFLKVAEIWGQSLNSDVPIRVLATFSALPCDNTRIVLGAALSYNQLTNFPNAAKANTWYPAALANKLAGTELLDDPDPTVSTDPNGLPAIWDHFLFDPKQGKVWAAMTNEERVASAITPRNLVWNGERVTRNAPRVLDRGVPELFVTGQGLNRFLMIGEAQFGPIIDSRMLIAQPIVPLVDGAGSTLACSAIDAASAAAVRGKMALIDRGTCPFTDKVKNAQNVGAKAVVIADNAPGTPPQPLLGADETITIPSLRVALDDGAAIKAAIAAGRPPLNVPYAVVFQNQLRLAGADYGNRVFMYTPNPRQQGSSVSHCDTSARRNLLMEPSINDDPTLSVRAPEDLTLQLLRDIGW
jgi:hypothetical protein